MKKLFKNSGTTLLVYTLLILIVSIAPINNGQRIDKTYIASFRLDHLLHTLMFLIWGILAIAYSQKKRMSWISFGTLFFGGLVFAVLAEGGQYFLSYRGYSVNDLIGNTLGVVITLVIGVVIRLKVKRSD